MKDLKIIIAVAALFMLPVCASVQAAGSGAETGIVSQAETYLRGLDTAYARFIQTSADGSQLTGTFYLNRPGKLRFEYDGFDDFIVADGRFIYFYDAALDSQSNAPIGQTLADFILRDDLRLSGDIRVTETAQAGPLQLVTLVQSDDPGAGTLILGFEQEPMKLKKWRVIDATGAISEIELFDFHSGVTLDGDLFIYRDPTPRGVYEFNE